MKKKLFVAFFFLSFFLAKAQTDEEKNPDFYFVDTIHLKEVLVFSKERKFVSDEARKQYLLLKNRVKKVYPYAKLAAERLEIMQKTMDTIANKRTKKRYIKRMQTYIENRFTDELKKLSRKQGQILVKLIHRQTGQTAYDLVKNLRNGLNAFMYNSTAWFYDISLKTAYNPWEVSEDFLIEEILLRAFSNDELEYQAPAFGIDFDKILEERLKKKQESNK